MNSWLVRGLALALAHVVIRTVLGFLIAQWPLHGTMLRWSLLTVVVLIAVAWGFVDGRTDRQQNPDPDDGEDLTMVWLKAALVGGLVAGVFSWAIGKLPNFDLGGQDLIFELTSGAAWTVLLIFVSAMIGIGIARFLTSRQQAKQESNRTPVAAGSVRDDEPAEYGSHARQGNVRLDK